LLLLLRFLLLFLGGRLGEQGAQGIFVGDCTDACGSGRRR